MEDWTKVVVDGVPYVHPVVAVMFLFIGSWVPGLNRTLQQLSRPLWALVRRI